MSEAKRGNADDKLIIWSAGEQGDPGGSGLVIERAYPVKL